VLGRCGCGRATAQAKHMTGTFKVRGHEFPLPPGMTAEEISVAHDVIAGFEAELDDKALIELRRKLPQCAALSDNLLRGVIAGDVTAKAALEFAIWRAQQPDPVGLLGTMNNEETND